MGSDQVELSPAEQNYAAGIVLDLMQRYSMTTLTSESSRQLEAMAVGRFAEEMGLRVSFVLDDPQPDGHSSSDRVWFEPQIIIEERLAPHATDHDEMKRQVAEGVAGNEAFYVREDGTQHLDPIRKQVPDRPNPDPRR